MDVMAPPSILDYTYSDENTAPVWRYVSFMKHKGLRGSHIMLIHTILNQK